MKNTSNDFTLFISETSDDTMAMEFVGKDKSLLKYKIPYAMPYENYDGIRKLQLKYQQEGYFCKEDVWALLDISEWIGHDEEDFFDITLKYLYDHRSDMKFLFVVHGYTKKECLPLYLKLRCYMNGNIKEDKTFFNTTNLSLYINQTFSVGKNESIFLAELISEKEMVFFRNYSAIESLINEIKSFSDNKKISMNTITAYLNNNDSLIAMLSEPISKKYAQLASELTLRKEK